MTESWLPPAKQPFVDESGNAIVSGKVYFYIPGTDIPKTTWQDPTMAIENAHPVILDDRGEAAIFGSGLYRQRVLDRDDVVIWDRITITPNVTVATYTLAAVDNWTTSDAEDFADDVFPERGMARSTLLSTGYNPVTRNIVYAYQIAPTANKTNTTGTTLWDGRDAIAPSAVYDNTVYGNFSVGMINIDTRAVTTYDAYDPTSFVPAGIGGGDGTWTRVAALNIEPELDDYYETTPVLSDPRNGNVWLNGDPESVIYNFRTEDDYALTISPLLNTGDLFDIIGLTDDWLYVAKVQSFILYEVNLIPRIRQPEEVAADYLLSFAQFPLDVGAPPNDERNYTCLDDAGNIYMMVAYSDDIAEWTWKLYLFEPPTSAPYGGPTVGGGWTDITPWGPTTGPNSQPGSGGYTDFPRDLNLGRLIWMREAQALAIFNCFPAALRTGGTENDWYYQVSYYRPSDATYVDCQTFLYGYMTENLAPTTEFAPDVAWAFAGNGSGLQETGLRVLDRYRQMHTYDFGDDDETFWLQFSPYPYDGVTYGNPTSVFAKFQLEFGEVPSLVRLVPETGWGDAYPDYAAYMGLPEIINLSMPQPFEIPPASDGSIRRQDEGIYDEATSSWWWSGQTAQSTSYEPFTPSFYNFDPAFENRWLNNINAPFMVMTLAGDDMTAAWLPPAKQAFFNDAGNPLVGGKVYFYEVGTDTPKDTWQEPTQESLNENPVILDARGEAPIFGSGLYRQVLTDADDNEIWDLVTVA